MLIICPLVSNVEFKKVEKELEAMKTLYERAAAEVAEVHNEREQLQNDLETLNFIYNKVSASFMLN